MALSTPATPTTPLYLIVDCHRTYPGLYYSVRSAHQLILVVDDDDRELLQRLWGFDLHNLPPTRHVRPTLYRLSRPRWAVLVQSGRMPTGLGSVVARTDDDGDGALGVNDDPPSSCEQVFISTSSNSDRSFDVSTTTLSVVMLPAWHISWQTIDIPTLSPQPPATDNGDRITQWVPGMDFKGQPRDNWGGGNFNSSLFLFLIIGIPLLVAAAVAACCIMACRTRFANKPPRNRGGGGGGAERVELGTK
ncbi:hypothetical protein B0H66DRAFT_589696 [Apodospora peruviana]|uniref:Uncharacterized protein n=1 Tax=Apodospora peruviana TaxID=516989 RepID=A0AAE0IBD9_9PEZI|nr:hypothetical protein B0H66DRAFT_589696 [Apodospora peruviana]